MDEEEKSKIVRFCPECQNILQPKEKDSQFYFQCRRCEHQEKVQDQNSAEEHLIYRKQLKQDKTNAFHANKYFALDPTMPRTTDVICPQCHYNEAVYFMTSDQEDTKLYRVYICARIEDDIPVCGCTWDQEK